MAFGSADVAAQGGVRAGDDVQAAGVGSGVGEDEAGRPLPRERRSGDGGVGVERDLDVGDALRAGGVVVEDEESTRGRRGAVHGHITPRRSHRT